MEKYLVYLHYLPDGKISYKTVHRSTCIHANKPSETNWKGYFFTLKAAENYANRKWVEVDDIRLCKVCIDK